VQVVQANMPQLFPPAGQGRSADDRVNIFPTHYGQALSAVLGIVIPHRLVSEHRRHGHGIICNCTFHLTCLVQLWRSAASVVAQTCTS
jgi:hypothetical protein